jgi:hypothetical protein
LVNAWEPVNFEISNKFKILWHPLHISTIYISMYADIIVV